MRGRVELGAVGAAQRRHGGRPTAVPPAEVCTAMPRRPCGVVSARAAASVQPTGLREAGADTLLLVEDDQGGGGLGDRAAGGRAARPCVVVDQDRLGRRSRGQGSRSPGRRSPRGDGRCRWPVRSRPGSPGWCTRFPRPAGARTAAHDLRGQVAAGFAFRIGPGHRRAGTRSRRRGRRRRPPGRVSPMAADAGERPS